MIKYKVSNIRDLVGPKVNLKMVYDNPICRLEKWKSVRIQDRIILSSEPEMGTSEISHPSQNAEFMIYLVICPYIYFFGFMNGK